MKLTVTIGSCTVNTTPSSFSSLFDPEDAKVLGDMLNLGIMLSQKGDIVTQYVNNVYYKIRCT